MHLKYNSPSISSFKHYNGVKELSQLDIIYNESPKFKTRYLARQGKTYDVINVSNISYIFLFKRKIFVQTKDGNLYNFTIHLDQLETELNNEVFFRINRQLIVNINSVQKVTSWIDGKLIVELNPAHHTKVIVSRLRSAEFKRWLKK